jgi:hypothetical protein
MGNLEKIYKIFWNTASALLEDRVASTSRQAAAAAEPLW